MIQRRIEGFLLAQRVFPVHGQLPEDMADMTQRPESALSIFQLSDQQRAVLSSNLYFIMARPRLLAVAVAIAWLWSLSDHSYSQRTPTK